MYGSAGFPPLKTMILADQFAKMGEEPSINGILSQVTGNVHLLFNSILCQQLTSFKARSPLS